jgi:aryl-alcohol dehydrogenase
MTKKITAAVVREKSQPFTLEELELDEPRANEVLVLVVATGICHTDLVVRDQLIPVSLPVVLGHEGAGIVECIGEQVTKVKPGDRVVMSYPACWSCANCRSGYAYYCDQNFRLEFGGSRLDGTTTLTKDGEPIHGAFFQQSSFATHALATENNIIKVREDVPLEILGPLGCGIETGAGAVINALRPKAGATLAVFGSGAVGLSAILAAALVGCSIIIGVDIRPNRLELAKSLRATHVINSSTTNPVEAVREITGGGVQYSLEASGVPSVFRQAVESLAALGTCGLVGGAPIGSDASADWMSILLGRRIKGIIQGESIAEVFIPQMIEWYAQGRFPFEN